MFGSHKRAVARGVQLLDKESPDWWRRIDLSLLYLLSPTGCILGQVYGDYVRGLRRLGIGGAGKRYGFMPLTPWRSRVLLEQEWTRVIVERREAARCVVDEARAIVAAEWLRDYNEKKENVRG